MQHFPTGLRWLGFDASCCSLLLAALPALLCPVPIQTVVLVERRRGRGMLETASGRVATVVVLRRHVADSAPAKPPCQDSRCQKFAQGTAAQWATGSRRSSFVRGLQADKSHLASALAGSCNGTGLRPTPAQPARYLGPNILTNWLQPSLFARRCTPELRTCSSSSSSKSHVDGSLATEDGAGSQVQTSTQPRPAQQGTQFAGCAM